MMDIGRLAGIGSATETHGHVGRAAGRVRDALLSDDRLTRLVLGVLAVAQAAFVAGPGVYGLPAQEAARASFLLSPACWGLVLSVHGFSRLYRLAFPDATPLRRALSPFDNALGCFVYAGLVAMAGMTMLAASVAGADVVLPMGLATSVVLFLANAWLMLLGGLTDPPDPGA
jgi:hypothetical protein